jgi:protein tyrosine phosphatase
VLTSSDNAIYRTYPGHCTRVCTTTQEMPRVVRQFHFHRWPDGASVPNSKAALLELIDMVENWQKQSGNKPVTVHCM